MLEKITVIGSPGAGKSVFARRLNEITHIPVYHLDMIWHRPDKTTISKQDFDNRLNDILLKDKWIIDGNYQRTIETRIKACDTAFLLDYPLEICLTGAKERIGKKRSDMPWIETEFDNDFKQFIIDYQTENLPLIHDMLKKYKDKNIVIFKSRQQSEQYLNELMNYYKRTE